MSQKLDRIWAPWRLEYIQNNNSIKTKSGLPKDCVFCKLISDAPSEKNLILYRDSEIFVIMNKFPYNPYHLMVLPIQHTGEVTDVLQEVWIKLNKATQACVGLIQETVSPHGFNLGMNVGEAGGAGIAPHLHMHIIPRWRGDTNFMPLIAETKALPTHNLTIYNALAPKFEHFADRL